MLFELALVTGASSGIGRALCQLLAKQKISLIISGRELSALLTLQQELSSGVNIQIVQADLRDVNDRKKLIKILHQQKPDLVVNNAGFGLYGEALTYSTHEQLSVLEVNTLAVLELTLEASRSLISVEKKGLILNVSSTAAFQFLPNMAVYAASKACVNSFSQALDNEVSEKGVRILVACPGIVNTSFQERAGASTNPNEILNGMTAEFVAEKIWQQIQQTKSIKIIDWRNHLLTKLSALIPKKWIARYVKKVIEKRIKLREIIKVNYDE